MSDIYANAVDSLRIGIEHFLKAPDYSSRKHAILTVFHAIELFLKEQLHRTNPILIYRNLDTKITDDSPTVGIKEALIRLENLGSGLPKELQRIIERIQQRRNRIEHHRYDHKQEDEVVISESLAFILFFVDTVLKAKLEHDVPPETLREIERLVYDWGQRNAIAERRMTQWMHEHWPSWNSEESDDPDDFIGTTECPICREDYLVMGYHESPFCFHCNTTIEADVCDYCGRTYLKGKGCCSPDPDS